MRKQAAVAVVVAVALGVAGCVHRLSSDGRMVQEGGASTRAECEYLGIVHADAVTAEVSFVERTGLNWQPRDRRGVPSHVVMVKIRGRVAAMGGDTFVALEGDWAEAYRCRPNP